MWNGNEHWAESAEGGNNGTKQQKKIFEMRKKQVWKEKNENTKTIEE